MKQRAYEEAAAVYFKAGTKAKIQAAADVHGMSTSTYIRGAVLQRLRRDLSEHAEEEQRVEV